MGSIWNTLRSLWVLFFGWMPIPLAVGLTVLIGLMIIILIIKLVAFVLDAIPFL